MECNKDDALKAKQIAEDRMRSGDFVGALKFAKKAQRLFPEIQNIAQILTVCEVHCAAENKLSTSDMDWYGILLTDKFTEEATIKKQYKKLALLLHPDKNKSAGAEAAFKLIVDANRVLGDQTKRSLYNMKIRLHNNFHSQSHTQNTTTFWTLCQHCNTKYEYYRTIENTTMHCQLCSKLFKARDIGFQCAPSGHTSSSSFNSYKYPPNHAPPKEASTSNGGKPYGKGPTEKFAPSCPVSMTKCSAGQSASCKVQKSKDGHGAAGVTKAGAGTSNRATSKANQSRTPTNVGSKRARKSASADSRDDNKDENGTSNPATSKAKQSRTPTNVGSKRARQSASADSRDDNKDENGTGMKDSNVKKSAVDPSGLDKGVHSSRSSKKKQHVSFTETAGDGEFKNASKRPRQDEPLKTTKVEKREVPANGGLFNNTSPTSFTADVAGQNGEMRNKENAQPGKTVSRNKMKTEPLNLQRKETPNPDIICCPDPEFSDFEKVRKEDCFAVGQYWAIYDNTDSMPRFYARIKKVHSPFKLEYTWLEPNPVRKDEIDWHGAGLPIACGKYKLGHSQITRELVMFSHEVHCIKAGGRGSYLVYPMKGETWAIFRHWNIGWSSKPEKNSEYQFEFVEVLSDFDENDGFKVSYLSKVKGFVCLFQQTVQSGISSCCIPPSELYRFSHRVPSFVMTGKERKGVPSGSFELDPAGLPKSVFQVGDHGDMKDKGKLNNVSSSCQESSKCKVEHAKSNEKLQVGDDGDMKDNGKLNNVSSSCQESSKCKVEHAKSNESIHKAKLRESGGTERVSPIIRRVSPRSNTKSMGNGQASTSQYMAREDDKNNSHMRDYSQPEGSEVAACQTIENFKTSKKPKRNFCGETLTVRRSPRDLSKKNDVVGAGDCATGNLSFNHSNTYNNIKETVFSQSVGSDSVHLKRDPIVVGACYDFNKEKSREMFQCGQIWAIYGERDNLPDVYVQIKKIESTTTNFKLHVSELEPCSSPKGLRQTMSCGSFKIKKAKPLILSPSAFSHQLKVEPMGNSIYEIYPKKGEIWALYKDQNYELTPSNQGRGRNECHIVEVLADSDKSIQVVVLVRHNRSQAIFKPPIILRSKTSTIEILRGDVGRFSHQIPVFKHNGKDDVQLRGCWVADPSSVPGFSHT